MSINLTTMGMFNSCCGTGGGGAPPYRRDEEKVTPLVLVKKVSVKTIRGTEAMLDNFKITLLSGGNK